MIMKSQVTYGTPKVHVCPSIYLYMLPTYIYNYIYMCVYIFEWNLSSDILFNQFSLKIRYSVNKFYHNNYGLNIVACGLQSVQTIQRL